MGIHLLDRLVLHKDIEVLLRDLTRDVKAEMDRLASLSASLEAMARSGIVRMYWSRPEAAKDIARDLARRNYSKLRLSGISLNDFMRKANTDLSAAWQDLTYFISSPEASRADAPLMDIKILIINPDCFGAQLRSEGEARGQRAMKGRLSDDVTAVAKSLATLERRYIATSAAPRPKTGVWVEARLYNLPPILFLCLTDSVCYVQQYFFWSDRDADIPISVLKYRSIPETTESRSLHSQMDKHFDWIWENASIPLKDYIEGNARGTEQGLIPIGAKNAYSAPIEAAKRIAWLLRNGPEGDGKGPKKCVAIQGISLHSFFETGGLLAGALAWAIELGNVPVRILLLEPECEQARHRAFRERLFSRRQTVLDSSSFVAYCSDQDQHRSSDLVRDTERTIEELRLLVKEIVEQQGDRAKLQVEVKKYRTAPTCFMLRVDDVVLVEQYHFGKVITSEEMRRQVLGKDMPLIEFVGKPSTLYEKVPGRVAFDLLDDHFNFVWALAEAVDIGIPEKTAGAQSQRDRK